MSSKCNYSNMIRINLKSGTFTIKLLHCRFVCLMEVSLDLSLTTPLKTLGTSLKSCPESTKSTQEPSLSMVAACVASSGCTPAILCVLSCHEEVALDNIFLHNLLNIAGFHQTSNNYACFFKSIKSLASSESHLLIVFST